MKIVIDATSLLLRSAGVRNYLQYWLLSLLEAAGQNDKIATYPFGVPTPLAIDHEHSVTGYLATELRLALVAFLNIRRNPAIDLVLSGADVFHASQHTANLPRRRKVTATIFDFSCWITPQYHTPENVAATRRYGDNILRSADGLIAISAHARNDAIELLQIPEERIRVIYPGVAESFFQVAAKEVHRSRGRYSLEAPYVLFVGCIEPRKNVPAIIRAYLQLPERLRRDLQLVVAGPFGWAGEEVRTMLLDSGKNIRYLGYVPETDLPGLLAGAVALVYPSYYEGFGLPVAQAMAAGVPVIGSDRSCLPEVIGDAGILVNPDSVEEIGAAIERICASSDFAKELTLRGKARGQLFHWSACAVQSLRFFHEVSPLHL
jgi:glycosyltransferase involved in cell wall biosynthesis